jgi:eukaryotic-like serine/threonine-protein kinase
VQEGLPATAPLRRKPRRPAAGARAHRERPPAETPQPRGAHWLLTWQRSVLAGIVAFLLLGLTAGGYMGLRNAGVGPFGSLIASGALDERERILISEFEASPGDDDLARALTQAFRVDLAQSSVLHVLEPGHARDVLERMGADVAAPVTAELARQIALRDGIKAYVTGDVLRAGRGYSLSASLFTVDGTMLASFRETAADSGAVLDAIGRLSRRMRERVGESLRAVNAAPRLESVTTPSLEALRKYTAAVHALEIELDSRQGIALLQEALAHDSMFGMAWRKLAVTYSNAGVSRDLVVEAATRAYRHRDRMTPREGNHAVAYYYMHVTRDNAAAIATYRSLLATYPDDRTAHNNLAVVYGRDRQYDLALEHQRRAIELSPGMPMGYTNLAFALHRLGRLDETAEVLTDYRQRFGETRQLLLEAVHLAYSRSHVDTAVALAQRLRDFAPQDALARADGAHVMADVAALRGRFADEERHRAMAVAAEVERGAPALPLMAKAWLAERDLDVLGDAPAALRRLNAALIEHPLAALAPADRPYNLLIQLFARAGDGDRARALFRDFEEAVPAELRGDQRTSRLWLAAAMARGEGDYAEALRQLTLAEPLEACVRCIAQAKAVLFDISEQPDSAIAYYERFISEHAPRGLWQDAYGLATSHERLAELYELRGELDRAVYHAGRFVELWQDADPLLRARVNSKLALLARLQERR